MKKTILAIPILAFALSCSQNKSEENKANQKNQENKENASKKENKPTLFPVIMAGSITLIQKLYLKKRE